MNKTERFREIAAKHPEMYDENDPYAWYETAPGPIVIDGHVIEVIESTNFNVDSTYHDGGGDDGDVRWNQWVLVKFEGDLYRMTSIYDSWDGTSWNGWQRVEKRPVTTYEYVEVDK